MVKERIRKWLGLDKIEIKQSDLYRHITYLRDQLSEQGSIGIDVHFKTPHMILIFSKLKGGQIRHLDVDIKDLKELKEMVDAIKNRYGIRETFYDSSPYLKDFLR